MKQKIKAGFFIIEFMISLLLFSMIIIFSLSFILSSTLALKKYNQLFHAQLNLLTNLDLLIHEITDLQPQHIINKPSLLIFKKEKKYTGFTLDKNRLIKLIGLYNEREQRWITKKKSILGLGIHRISFKVENHDIINLITCTLENVHSFKTSRTCTMRLYV